MARAPSSPLQSRLLFRVYSVGLLHLMVVGFSFFVVDRLVRKAPWEHELEHARAFVGALAEYVDDPETLRRSVDLLHRQLGTSLTLYRKNGTLLASSPRTPMAPLSDEQVAKIERDGDLLVRREQGHDVSAVAVLQGGTMVAYGLVKRLPSPSRRHPSPVIPLAFALGGIGIVSLLFARSLARPLGQLAAAARAFGSGDLSARARFARSDELGEVARTFNEMAERVNILLRSQKEFLANVSHELRTPLARIRVALDIAAEAGADGGKPALADIAEDWRELDRLVDELLMAARFDLTDQTGTSALLQYETVDAEALVARAVARLKTLHPGRVVEVAVVKTPASEPGANENELAVDPVLIGRVLDNLLNNAAGYSDSGTPIQLTLRQTAQAAEFTILDHGIGIEAADLPHLFTPFFRTDRSRARKTGGVGLGLAIAKRIVEAHGGTFAIASKAGKGTAVTFSLPTLVST